MRSQTPGAYALHPALVDAALASLGLWVDGAYVPKTLGAVTLGATHATSLRVHARRLPESPSTFSLTLFDASGLFVASLHAVRLEEASGDGLLRREAQGPEALYRVDWQPLRYEDKRQSYRFALVAESAVAIRDQHQTFEDVDAMARKFDAGGTLPDAIVAFGVGEPTAAVEGDRLAHAVHAATKRALALVKAWLRDERFTDVPFVVVTRRAVATSADDPADDLAHAAIWGLVRSAQNEHPERKLVLVDVDELESALEKVSRALASGEPQVAFRRGQMLAPRLTRVSTPPRARELRLEQGTVLVTGGTGALGALIARHLVERHGARHLLLLSRRGQAADGATELADALRKRGADVRIAACDVADRGALEATIRTIPEDHPLRAVVHTAGVIDDGFVEALDDERVDRVLSSKVDAAIHLHELTAKTELSAFVLFSSLTGILGGPGQASYAAANTFLDALATSRRSQGLAASSLAWGLWAERSAMTSHLGEHDFARLGALGIAPLSSKNGLSLFDAALASDEAAVVTTSFDLRALRRTVEDLPHVLRSLVPRRAVSAHAPTTLAERLASLSEAERSSELHALVRLHVRAVFGLANDVVIAATRPLKELGLDSLTALQIRKRLAVATGLGLPATFLFDHPTPDAMVKFFLSALSIGGRGDPREATKAAAPDEPIAIVAMSCRLPGGVTSPEDFRQLLVDGRDAVTPLPDDRDWHLEEADAARLPNGGFLTGIDRFDAAFFGISPREAVAMDPQQRLLLEACWETLERAGIDPSALQGLSTGTFVGLGYADYLWLTPREADADGLALLGNSASVASGRIAYTLGLEGPALTVDTACSASLVAVHLACQALRNGDCSLALAGGATVFATGSIPSSMGKMPNLSARDGRCRAFSADADGAGWSEGVGVIALERLSDALRNEHPVLAVIRGSAVNQDGRSQGLTAPNGPAQERVIRKALGAAGLSGAEIDVVEAHGTGTSLGDPIEAQALLATYGSEHSTERPLWIGSVKSNIGHTLAAAGITGLIKMVLALGHGVVPRTLHAETPSNHIDWSSGALRLVQERMPWPMSGSRPRRAAVSAFGISGTNAHLVLEEAPRGVAAAAQAKAAHAPGTSLAVLSAKTATALRAQARALHAHLVARDDVRLADVAFSLATTRAAFAHRAAILADDRTQLLTKLEALANDRPVGGTITGAATEGSLLAVLFTGQGSQRAGMGRALHLAFPRFAEALDETASRFDRLLSRPLRDVLFAEPGSVDAALLDQTAFTQPALFALELALFRLFESWGLRPDRLLGHSIGEITAAHVAGVFSLEHACTLVAARGRLMQALPHGGAMCALEATEEEVKPHLLGRESLVDIAAINAPRSCRHLR